MSERLASPDFTEARFRDLLRLAKAHYRFARFGDTVAGPHILWRHDVDCSVQRAHRLAAIEAEAGVRANYFFLLDSPYYNLFEAANTRLARAILGLGHACGLHFDPEWSQSFAPGADIEERMARERDILSDLLGADVSAVSFHNPAHAGVMDMTAEHLAGMVNAYGGAIRREYLYCSDSFGFWRFAPLDQVLVERRADKLHALTHPEWWTQAPLGIRARLTRCIEGRAAATARFQWDIWAEVGMLDTVDAEDARRR